MTDEQFECLENTSLAAGETIMAKWFQPMQADEYHKNFRMTRGMNAESWCYSPDFAENTDDEVDEASQLRASSVVLEGAANLVMASAVALVAITLN
jgi:hypothetical protein